MCQMAIIIKCLLLINIVLLNNVCAFICPEYLMEMEKNMLNKKPPAEVDGFSYGYNIYNEEYPYSKGPIGKTEEYDFIVVGSGSAGAVVANRLSEISEWSVLLLEQGKPGTFFTDIPAIAGWFSLTDYAWPYKMAKQDNVCLAMKNQQCAWPRGKALGGTSIINYMIYSRGNKHDFEKWAALDNPGWSWNEVLPYYIRSENASALKYSDDGKHGKNGYLNVENVNYKTILADTFLEAAREMGHPILDYNGNQQMGFSYIQSTTRSGRRCSAAKAFIKPVEYRPNLRILPMSRVTRIIIDPTTKQALGVEYLRNKKEYIALARKEVIVSAGPIASPQLLMLSGVGPKNHLDEFGIPVIKDLPVGQFLKDHISFMGLTFLVNETVGFNYEDAIHLKYFNKYIKYGKGPLTSLGGVEAIGYIRTNQSKDNIDTYPDVEFLFISGSLNTDNGTTFRETFNIRKSFYDDTFKEINGLPSWSVLPMLLHPKSRGFLRLKSRNIFSHPILYGNYYTDPANEDIKTMIAAIREIKRLAKTRAFKRYRSILYKKPYAGCQHLPYDTDAYWECAVRHLTVSLHHQTGTCKMGPKTDKEAVVDNTLKVHGVKRLRVVDSSIIPLSISAHTNAPSSMIGEKASDYIKAQWLPNNFIVGK